MVRSARFNLLKYFSPVILISGLVTFRPTKAKEPSIIRQTMEKNLPFDFLKDVRISFQSAFFKMTTYHSIFIIFSGFGFTLIFFILASCICIIRFAMGAIDVL